MKAIKSAPTGSSNRSSSVVHSNDCNPHLSSPNSNDRLRPSPLPDDDLPRRLPAGYVPSENTVILGRGKRIQSHLGNRRFMALIEREMEDYNRQAHSKASKSDIIDRVLSTVLHWNSMAAAATATSLVVGFVRERKPLGSNLWMAVDRLTARNTVAQAFRNANHECYRSSKQSKQAARRRHRRPNSNDTDNTTTNDGGKQNALLEQRIPSVTVNTTLLSISNKDTTTTSDKIDGYNEMQRQQQQCDNNDNDKNVSPPLTLVSAMTPPCFPSSSLNRRRRRCCLHHVPIQECGSCGTLAEDNGNGAMYQSYNGRYADNYYPNYDKRLPYSFSVEQRETSFAPLPSFLPPCPPPFSQHQQNNHSGFHNAMLSSSLAPSSTTTSRLCHLLDNAIWDTNPKYLLPTPLVQGGLTPQTITTTAAEVATIADAASPFCHYDEIYNHNEHYGIIDDDKNNDDARDWVENATFQPIPEDEAEHIFPSLTL